jgi:uncharacterized repeat protein (TIGR01451 family)
VRRHHAVRLGSHVRRLSRVPALILPMVGGSFGAGGQPGAITYNDTNILGLGTPTLTESVDKGANGVYPSGATASYTLTVGNSGLLSGLAVTIQDQLPASMALSSAPISILDVGTGVSIGCGGAIAVCSTANNTLSITGLVIGILESFQITFSPVVAGLGRACSTATDRAIASSLLGGSSSPVSIPITICDTGLAARVQLRRPPTRRKRVGGAQQAHNRVVRQAGRRKRAWASG